MAHILLSKCLFPSIFTPESLFQVFSCFKFYCMIEDFLPIEQEFKDS